MNSLQAMQTKKKPQKVIRVDNPLESLQDVGTSVVDSVKSAGNDAVKDMWAQLLGGDKYAAKPGKMSGDLKPGQELNLSKAAAEKKKAPQAEAPINYFREIAEAGKTGMYKEKQQIRQDVQAILYELQRLASSSKALQKEVSLVTSAPVVNPGKYHVTFFEWMLTVVKDARKRVENAGAWLRTVKKKKGFVQGMKKNMSQLMSGERSVSNQTA